MARPILLFAKLRRAVAHDRSSILGGAHLRQTEHYFASLRILWRILSYLVYGLMPIASILPTGIDSGSVASATRLSIKAIICLKLVGSGDSLSQ